MGFVLTAKMCTFTLLVSLFIFISVSGYQFEVGGERGWALPLGNETETYNEWAEQNRFQIGDTLYFKYQEDTALLVSQQDYENCNGSSPIEGFGEGGAMFEFNRHGFFYFISGIPENCEAGQRVIIRVMVQDRYHLSYLAPAPAPVGSISAGRGVYGWHSGADSGSRSVPVSSATMVSVASSLITSITGVMFVGVGFYN